MCSHGGERRDAALAMREDVLGGYWYGDIVGLGGGGTVICIPFEIIPGFGEF